MMSERFDETGRGHFRTPSGDQDSLEYPVSDGLLINCAANPERHCALRELAQQAINHECLSDPARDRIIKYTDFLAPQ
jgi:hypothetical protein